VRLFESFEKVGDIFREVGGFSEILKINLRFWEDSQRMSEDTFVHFPEEIRSLSEKTAHAVTLHPILLY